jgi:hypothetical protein
VRQQNSLYIHHTRLRRDQRPALHQVLPLSPATDEGLRVQRQDPEPYLFVSPLVSLWIRSSRRWG